MRCRPVYRIMMVRIERIISVHRIVAEYRIEPRIPPDGSEVRVIAPAPPRVPVVVKTVIPSIIAVKVAPSPADPQVGPVRIVVIAPIIIRCVVKIVLVQIDVFQTDAVGYRYKQCVFYESEFRGLPGLQRKGICPVFRSYKVNVRLLSSIRKLGQSCFVVPVCRRFASVI